MKISAKKVLVILATMGIIFSSMWVYADDEYPDLKPLTVVMPIEEFDL